MNTKHIYQFSVNRQDEIEEAEISKNEAGEEIKTIKKVKKQTPVVFAIRKPNRKLREDAEMFYAVKMSEGIKSGLLTRALLSKRYINDGGAMSEPERVKMAELYVQFLSGETELQKIQLNLENLSEDVKKEKLKDAAKALGEVRAEIEEINIQQNNLFEHTAESKAENKTVFWWMINLALQEEGKDFNPLFKGDSYEAKLDAYEAIEENEDLFWLEVLKKFTWYTSAWYHGGISTKEDFDRFSDTINAA